MITTLYRQLVLVFFLLVCCFFFSLNFVSAQTTGISWSGTDAVTYGYAWSDNVGWISFNCDQTPVGGVNDCVSAGGDDPDYNVTISSTDGSLNGYAWSDNVGWVQFGGLSAFPAASFSDASVRRYSADNNDYLYGWARACAGTENGDCSTMTDHSDGWDGWISLTCANHGGGCGAYYAVQVQANGQFNGYAWGGDVFGWISFEGVGYEVEFDQPCIPTLACNAELDGYTETNQWCVVLPEVSCDVGYSCTENVGCEFLSIDYTFTSDRTYVRTDQTVDLSWSFPSGLIAGTACEINGNNGDSWTADAAGGTVTSSPLDRQSTLFTLSCAVPGGDVATSTLVTTNSVLGEGGSIDQAFDNITDGENGIVTEAEPFYVEFDLGSLMNLTQARIFGDGDGSWYSTDWSMFYKVNVTDDWTEVFVDSDAYGNQWFSEIFDVNAQYVRIEVSAVSGRVRFGELEIYSDNINGDPIDLETIEVNLLPEIIES